MNFLTAILTAVYTLLNPIAAIATDAWENRERIEVVPSFVSVEDSYKASERVSIALSGVFPNHCYRPVATQVSQVDNKILITDTAMVQGSSFCNMALRPYNKSVDLGTLAAGEYELYINDAGVFKPAAKVAVE